MSPSLTSPGGEPATDSWRESDARLRAHARLQLALAAARADGRAWLFEAEAMAAAAALEIAVPRQLFLRDAAAAERAELDGFPGDRLMLKLVAPGVPVGSFPGGVQRPMREPHLRTFPDDRGVRISADPAGRHQGVTIELVRYRRVDGRFPQRI